jgi:hypothetical protein
MNRSIIFLGLSILLLFILILSSVTESFTWTEGSFGELVSELQEDQSKYLIKEIP